MKPERESFDPTNNFDYDEDDEQAFTNNVPEADAIDKNGKHINQQYLNDLVINVKVLLPHDETQHMAKVICRTIDSNGKIKELFMKTQCSNRWCMMLNFQMVL